MKRTRAERRHMRYVHRHRDQVRCSCDMCSSYTRHDKWASNELKLTMQERRLETVAELLAEAMTPPKIRWFDMEEPE